MKADPRRRNSKIEHRIDKYNRLNLGSLSTQLMGSRIRTYRGDRLTRRYRSDWGLDDSSFYWDCDCKSLLNEVQLIKNPSKIIPARGHPGPDLQLTIASN